MERFFSGTGTSYDRVIGLGTLGLDRWWKARILGAMPRALDRVVDQGSGTGNLTFRIARRYPGARVVGVELRREYAAIARRRASVLGLERVSFVQGLAEEVAFRPGSIDCVTSSCLAKYADAERLAANLGAMLRPGGVALLHDFTYPRVHLFARVWEWHLVALRRLWARPFPEWAEAFSGFGDLMRTSRWVAEVADALGRHGFAEIRTQSLSLGAAALLTAVRSRRGGR